MSTGGSEYTHHSNDQRNIVLQNVQLAYNPSLQPVASSSSHYSSSPVQVARPQPPQQQQEQAASRPQSLHAPAVMSYQSKYGELLNVIEDLGREIKPTYAGSKMAQERLKKGIMHARALVRECLAEVDKSARQ